VTLKFGDVLSTPAGRNAPGPSLSTETYNSALSNPTSTVPKSVAAIETAGCEVIVTTCRPLIAGSPITRAAIIESNATTLPVSESTGLAWAPGIVPVAGLPVALRNCPSNTSATTMSPSVCSPPPATFVGKRFVASVTNTTWLPSVLTAGDHDERLPATGRRDRLSAPTSTADTSFSGAPRGGSSKTPLASVSRSYR
jgi:hypothetical protein